MTSPLVNPAAGYISLSRLDSSRSCPSIVTANRSGALPILLGALLGCLVVTQPQEAGEAQPPVPRPVAVADLDHQLRIDPVGAAGILARHRPLGERRGLGRQRLQPGQQ